MPTLSRPADVRPSAGAAADLDAGRRCGRGGSRTGGDAGTVPAARRHRRRGRPDDASRAAWSRLRRPSTPTPGTCSGRGRRRPTVDDRAAGPRDVSGSADPRRAAARATTGAAVGVRAPALGVADRLGAMRAPARLRRDGAVVRREARRRSRPRPTVAPIGGRGAPRHVDVAARPDASWPSVCADARRRTYGAEVASGPRDGPEQVCSIVRRSPHVVSSRSAGPRRTRPCRMNGRSSASAATARSPG